MSGATPATRRYTAAAQALHWVTAALMFTVLPLAWVMVNMAEGSPSRGLLYTLHKSVGLTILALVAVRLAWRARHPAPPLPGRLARWEAASAFASHWLLYLVLAGMPVSGYLLSAAGGHPVTYFGLFTLPGLPKDDALAQAALWTHVVVGQWLVYALILLHLAATAWHVAVRRDTILDRMLPEQAVPAPQAWPPTKAA
jgi:cytochrome b561